ncbi:MAG: aldehyde dehydrogenase family protein [Pseudomonadota bacterium]
MATQYADAFTTWFGEDVLKSWIGGALFAGHGDTVAVDDPTTGQTAFSYPDGGAAAASAALEAADAGGRAWRALTPSDRGLVLFRASERIRERAEDLSQLEALTAAKPIRDARAEVGRVADMFSFYAGYADKLNGDVVPVPTTHMNVVLREPLGTIVQLTPWNAPIFTAGWQLAPALATGNAVVLKPSELTPASSIALAQLLQESGVPAGAVNVVAGLGPSAGQTLVTDERVGKVVFIGSVPTGRKVAALAAGAGRPALLELGGKSANIVFADADLARAAKAAQAGIFAAAGQSCTAGARLLVERSAYDQLITWVAHGAQKLQVGAPLDAQTEVGPINNRAQFDHINRMVAEGGTHGARAVTGGGRPDSLAGTNGFYFAPTVLADVTNDMTIAREEVFGPVLAVVPFDSEEEAIAIANDSAFDLAGAVWTSDQARGLRVAQQLRAGTVWVNGYRALSVMSPFGGMRGSGFGRSSGRDVLSEYTQSKSIWIETDPQSPQPFGYGPEA